jgi:hypothetical protein
MSGAPSAAVVVISRLDLSPNYVTTDRAAHGEMLGFRFDVHFVADDVTCLR